MNVAIVITRIGHRPGRRQGMTRAREEARTAKSEWSEGDTRSTVGARYPVSDRPATDLER